MDAHSIILAPVVTEKTNVMRESEKKKYAFRVDSRANKLQIMQAITDLFSVKPVACHVMNVKPKPRNFRSKSGSRLGHTSRWKKAIVTLKAGDKIDIFEGA